MPVAGLSRTLICSDNEHVNCSINNKWLCDRSDKSDKIIEARIQKSQLSWPSSQYSENFDAKTFCKPGLSEESDEVWKSFTSSMCYNNRESSSSFEAVTTEP
jgi:hypothetical protein